MRTENVLIFIHGMMLEERPPLGRVQYRQLWDALLASHETLAERFDDSRIVEVEWGKFAGYAARPDQWINFAEEFVAREVDPDEVRKRPGPLNLVYPDAREVPLSQMPWRAMLNPLRQVLMIRGMGDLIYYCGEDGQTAVQLNVFEQIFEQLERYRLGAPARLRLHIIAHSLGFMLAHDFLVALFGPRPPDLVRSHCLQGLKALCCERLEAWRALAHERLEIGSLVSLGSPLPLMLFKDQRAVDQLGTGNTLSVKDLGLPAEGPEVVWKNFYDVNDLLAFPVRPLYGNPACISDAQVRPGDDPWSHSAYWGNADVHEQVAELLVRRALPPPPDEDV